MRRFKRYLICVDNELNIVKNDNAFLSYLGMKELHNLSQIIPPPDFMQLQNCMFAIGYGKTNLTCFRVRSGNNGLDWFAANINKPENPEEPIQIELSDIQTMKSGSTDSYYDKMTGLYNKNTITDYAMNLMQSKDHSPFYFFLMDIDNFKSVNDTFGHMKGDEIITDVAHIAKEFVGDNGVVGRIGGDEFMLVLENVSTEHDLRIILKNIRKTVEEKYQDMGNNVCVTVSMGGALFPADAFDYESMFTLADKMLYLAKEKGRNRYIIYTPELHEKLITAKNSGTAPVMGFPAAFDNIGIMQYMLDNYLRKDASTNDTAFASIGKSFQLSEILIVYDKGRNGFRWTPEEVGYGEKDLTWLSMDEKLTSLFDKNHLLVIDGLYNLTDDQKFLLEPLTQRGVESAIFYQMLDKGVTEGYVMFAKKIQRQRWAEYELLALSTIAKIFEISIYH